MRMPVVAVVSFVPSWYECTRIGKEFRAAIKGRIGLERQRGLFMW